MNTAEQKNLLRKQIREAERILSEDFRQASDRAICRNILSLETYQKAGTVFLFVGCGRETDTTELLEDSFAKGKRVLVPLCMGKGIMEARKIGSLNDLSPGMYGIPEPGPDSERVPFEEIEFALIPCLSCDRFGNRLGKGGGFYDRFLEDFKGDKAMTVRECLMHYAIPTEEHDIAVRPVVTDHHIYD